MISLPQELEHVAIIMDGNGRWANARGLPRTMGHKEGVKSVRSITTACAESGLKQLTLYALSVENYSKRPKPEIDLLLRLLKRFVIRERTTIMDNDIRFRVIGDVEAFPENVLKEIRSLEDVSRDNEGMVMCLALNYGGRSEIARAARRISGKVRSGDIEPEAIDEEMIAAHLYDPEMPDPDLLVRTAGEMRISNFLLWQLSYSEIYVTETFWPDFDVKSLEEAIAAYSGRKRKFGGLFKRLDA